MLNDQERLARGQAIDDLFKLYKSQVPQKYGTSQGLASKVIGIGMGRKIKRIKGINEVVAERSVRFYVERKIPKQAIHPDYLIPESVADFQTDVIETGRFSSF